MQLGLRYQDSVSYGYGNVLPLQWVFGAGRSVTSGEELEKAIPPNYQFTISYQTRVKPSGQPLKSPWLLDKRARPVDVGGWVNFGVSSGVSRRPACPGADLR